MICHTIDMNISKETQAREYIDNFPIQKTKVDDIEIEYKILGNKSGRPIIFIPGFKVTMDMWEPIILKRACCSQTTV